MRYLAVVIIVLALQPLASGAQTWAVLSSPEVQRSGEADLIQVSLGGLASIRLVERDRIAEVLAEIELASAFGDEDPSVRLRAGALLGADVLVFVRPAQPMDGVASDDATLEVVICDTRVGARLAVRTIARQPEDQSAAQIVEAARAVLEQFPDGVERIICVPPFVSQALDPKFEYLQERLAFVVQGLLAPGQGTALMAVGEVRAIEREQLLQDAVRRSVGSPSLIEGSYDVTWNADRKAYDYKLVVTVVAAGDSKQTWQGTFDDLASVVAALRGNEFAGLLDPRLVARAEECTPETRVRLLGARADAFARLGQPDRACELREALLLMHPEETAQRRRLLEDYLTSLTYLLRTRTDILWTMDRDPLPDWSKAAEVWPRAFDAYVQIKQGGVERVTELDALYERLIGALRSLRTKVPDAPGAPWTGILQRLEDADEVVLTHLEAPYREIAGLPPSGTIVDPVPASLARSFDEWLAAVTSRPNHGYLDLGTRRVENLVAALLRQRQEYPYVSPVALRNLLSSLLQSYDAQRVDAALQRLAGSPWKLHQRYAAVGRAVRANGADAGPAVERELDAMLEAFPGAKNERTVAAFRRVLEQELARAKSAGGAQPEEPEGEDPVATAARIPVEPFPMEVVVRDGSRVPLANDPDRDAEGYVARSGPWLRLVPCGTVDLLYNARTILLHESPGQLRELYFRWASESRRSVIWDGENIWISDVQGGLWIIAPDGREVARIGEADGLPGYEHGLVMTPIVPGRVMAAGSFGPQNRVWVADIRLNDGAATVEIIHEARTRYSDPSARTREFTDPGVTFELNRILAYRDPLRGGATSVLVRREEPGWPLQIDPDSGAVRVADFTRGHPLRRFRGLATVLPDGSWLMPQRGSDVIVVRAGPGRLLPGPTLTRTLAEQKGFRLYGDTIAYGGWYYVPGAVWHRYNAETGELFKLGTEPGGQSEGDRGFAASVHAGLLSWDSQARFYRVQPPVDPDGASVALRQVRVVDAAGKPLADARVFLGAPHAAALTTDAAGIAKLPAALQITPAAGVQVEAFAGGHAPAVVSLHGPRAELQDGVLRCVLEPLVLIGGTLVDRDGKPLAGYQVRVQRDVRTSVGFRSVDDVFDVDERGVWKATLMGADLNELTLLATTSQSVPVDDHTHPAPCVFDKRGSLRVGDMAPADRAALQAGAYVFRVAERDRTRPAETPLVTAITPDGGMPAPAIGGTKVRVVDPDGQPVRGVILMRSIRGDGYDRLPFEDGVAEVPSGRSAVIKADGFAYHPLRRVTPKRIELEPERIVTVEVIDEADQPAAGVLVEMRVGGTQVADARTDAAGVVTMAGVPSAGAEFRPVKRGYFFEADTVRDSETKQVFRMQVKRALPITIVAVDADTGAAIDEFRVAPRDRDPIDARGPLEYALPNDRVQVVTLSARGYVSKERRLKPGGPSEVRVRLKRGEAISGQLVDAAGQPLAGAQVALLGKHRSLMVRDGRVASGSWLKVETDDDGSFVFNAFPDAETVAYYGPDGYAGRSVKDLRENPVLQAAPLAAIRGSWPADAPPRAELTWMADRTYIPGMQFSQELVAGPDGRFEQGGLPAGRGWLYMRTDRTYQPSASVSLPLKQYPLVQTLTLEPGQTHEIDWQPQGREVSGRIAWAEEGAPQIAKLAVSPYDQKADPRPHPWAPGDVIIEDSTFRFDDIAPGRYRATIVTPEDRSYHRFVFDVPEGPRGEPVQLPVVEVDKRQTKAGRAEEQQRAAARDATAAGESAALPYQLGIGGALVVLLGIAGLRRLRSPGA